jgi:hypothetical protein
MSRPLPGTRYEHTFGSHKNGVSDSRTYVGLDHGAGHPLLLLCDAKTPHDKKSKEFKALGHYLCNVSIGLL